MRKLPFCFLCFVSFLGACLILFFCFPKTEKTEEKQTTYLELWHIDTFEGGIGSRKAFLEKVAAAYSKKSDTVITVLFHTAYSAERNFEKNVYPDMVSYGSGVSLPYHRLVSLKNTKKANNNGKTESGGARHGGNEYAAAWCAGGYVRITRGGTTPDGLIISEQERALSLLAVRLSGETLPVKQTVSSDKAIYSFYADKKAALVGTQRDLFRLENKMTDIEVKPYYGYNDLYQYVSILSADDKKAEKCKYFIDYLLGDEVGKKLDEIGMARVLKNGQILPGAHPLDCFGGSYSYALPAFADYKTIERLKSLALSYESNAESIKSALKYLK